MGQNTEKTVSVRTTMGRISLASPISRLKQGLLGCVQAFEKISKGAPHPGACGIHPEGRPGCCPCAQLHAEEALAQLTLLLKARDLGADE